MTLTPSQARAFYDRFGKKQDTQAFYEDAALDELVAHAAFEQAGRVFEFGCGTGRFASRLLSGHLPPSASYLGSDLSRTMTVLATERLAQYADRAAVVLTDGAISFPLRDHSCDRVVVTYVLDLLSATDIRRAMSEAHRVLAHNGRLCMVSLTTGNGFASRVVSRSWSALFSLHAPLVGGCRPIQLESFLDSAQWSMEYRHVVTRFAVPSEVVVARPAR